jgi:hypothetical protein
MAGRPLEPSVNLRQAIDAEFLPDLLLMLTRGLDERMHLSMENKNVEAKLGEARRRFA